MAGLPTNTFATYEAVGNREDLSDIIYRIDPTERVRSVSNAIAFRWP